MKNNLEQSFSFEIIIKDIFNLDQKIIIEKFKENILIKSPDIAFIDLVTIEYTLHLLISTIKQELENKKSYYADSEIEIKITTHSSEVTIRKCNKILFYSTISKLNQLSINNRVD